MRMNLSRTRLLGLLTILILALSPLGAWAQGIRGKVTNGGKTAVVGATVYLVPGADVARLKMAPSFYIRRNVADD